MQRIGKHKEICVGKVKGEENTAPGREARGANKRQVGRHSEIRKEELKKKKKKKCFPVLCELMLYNLHQIVNGKINNVKSAASEVDMAEYNNKYKLEIQLGML